MKEAENFSNLRQFHIGFGANMYGETSAYILSYASISGIKNPKPEYDNKTVAPQMKAYFSTPQRKIGKYLRKCEL